MEVCYHKSVAQPIVCNEFRLAWRGASRGVSETKPKIVVPVLIALNGKTQVVTKLSL